MTLLARQLSLLSQGIEMDTEEREEKRKEEQRKHCQVVCRGCPTPLIPGVPKCPNCGMPVCVECGEV